MTRCGVTVAALAALAAVVACSSSNGGASTAAGFAQQYCALLAPCCADAGLSANTSTCAELISALGQGYNPSAGQACLNAATQASKEPGFCSSASMSSSACNDVFSNSSSSGGSGSVQPGGSCQLESDCAPASGGGASCLGGGFSADGGLAGSQCIQTTTGTAGQGPCIGTLDGSSTETSWSGDTAPPSHAYVCNIASGLTCNQTTHQCSAQVGTGQACDQDQDCVAADYCDFSGSNGSACAPRLANGSSCATSSSACMTTSYCDPTQTCQPALPTGAACGSGNSAPCQSGLCVNSKCSSSSNTGLALVCG